MELKHRSLFILLCANIFLCLRAQVTFYPDQEGNVNLQTTFLSPNISVTTRNCYSSSPHFEIQYATLNDFNTVYDIPFGETNYATIGSPVPGGVCESSQSQYRVVLDRLSFISNPVLVGGTFHIKVRLDRNEQNITFSRRTYTFPAPYNLTRSAESAVLNSTFTWTCHVTSDYPIIEWVQDKIIVGQAGVPSEQGCKTVSLMYSYIYGCQMSNLTYTLTIPANSLKQQLQDSLWRCKDANNTVAGSKFVDLDIIIPVTSVTISPGSGSTIATDESQTVAFSCITNNANPPPTIFWFVGSSNLTSQAGSNRTTLILNVNRTYHNKEVKCVAWNTAGNKSDSTRLDVRFPPANNEELKILGYTSGEVLYENKPPIINISCSQPGGNPVANMTLTCGSHTGTNTSTAAEALRLVNLTNDRNLNGLNCTCVSSHINRYMRSKIVSFTVYYPPSLPSISPNSSFPWKAPEITGFYKLICNTVRGNPADTMFVWLEGDTELQTSQIFSFHSLNSSDNGRKLRCQIRNNFTQHENVVLNSSVIKVQVEYDPVVILEQSSLEVIEGNTAELRCTATGNPVPDVMWYEDSTPVTKSNISSSVYTIVNASRTFTGNYTCRANSTSVGDNVMTPDKKTTLLRVLYPPTVSLYLDNTTENTENHVIRCLAAGDPNNATIVALQQRIGLIVIRNITDFTESSPGNITLTIPTVSYKDMGAYTCLASNGIPDRSNQKIQSDTAYLNVISSAKFEMMQYIVRSDIDTQAVAKIPFYINPPATESDVVWTKNTGSSNETLVSSANLSFLLSGADVHLKVHSVDVTLRGQSAIMNVTSFQNYYEGNYTLQIRSSHTISAEVTVTLKRSGPPDTPSDFRLLTSTVSSVVLTWNKGSDGGHPQTFVILYKEKKTEVYNVKQIFDTTVNVTIKDEIEHLKSDTNYEFLLYSFNEKGNSTDHKTLERRTLKETSTSLLNSGLVGGAAGGGAALLVIIAALAVVLKRRQNKREDNDSKGILNSKEMSAGPSKRSDDDEDEGLMKLKKQSPSRVREDPPPIYAEVEKSNKKNGDAYEVVDGFKEKETQFNDPVDTKKNKEGGQRGYRNQDGLLYVDVKFDQPPPTGKPIIRGEERTGYAMIEFEEPPTYSTADDVKGAEGGK